MKLDKNSGVTRHHDWLGKHARLIARTLLLALEDNQTSAGSGESSLELA